MASSKKITVKLVVDKEKSRVVLAESHKDFVDILFSFLTLPMGTIIRLLGPLGCLGNLYQSVENLDTQHLQTEACKDMLLRPLSAAAIRCESLTINIDDTERPRKFYVCERSDCCANATCFYSSVRNARCGLCRRPMGSDRSWRDEVVGEEVGGFVKEGLSFIISDNLHVMPGSTMHTLSLLDKLGITDVSILEERNLDLGSEEVSNLLKRALVSNMPLTSLCFPNSDMIDSTEKLDTKELIQPKAEGLDTEAGTECRKISTKLLLDKANNKVVYAEAGEELMDLIFSFLTFPLGSVINLLNKKSRIGCVDHLYRSIEDLSIDYMKSEECRNMLLSPKLAPFFACSNQLLKMDEVSSRGHRTRGCYTCYWKKNECEHVLGSAVMSELNPKRPDGGAEKGGGFAKVAERFIVADDLCLSPLSPIFTIQAISKSNVPVSSLVEREVSIGENQALHLLREALISQAALSNVFFPMNMNRTRRP